MNLPQSVYERAMKQPEQIAYEFMNEQYTYAQFEQSVAQFAGALKEHGVKKGDHIALLVGNTPHFLVTLYASWRLGAVVVPINPIYTANEISYIVQNSDAKIIVALDRLWPMFDKREILFPNIEIMIVCETDEEAMGQCMQLEELFFFRPFMKLGEPVTQLTNFDKNDNAIILYTSGTMGQPKGAMLTHENVYSNARDVGTYLEMSSDDRVVATLPIFHVFALTVVVNAPLFRGATVLLLPRFSPKEVFEVIRERKATVFAGVPTMYNFLYQFEEGKREDYESIRLSISGGSSLPVSLLHNFEEKFNTRISEGYGLSEASPVTCFNPIDRERVPGSIGMSIVNVENKVVDTEGNEVPKGDIGELIVRGPNVMKGYYKMPEETNAVLKDGWLYTGDMAREDENGYFYIVDRKKDMIIVGGYNVYPREVEEVLYKHPDIIECAIIGIPDVELGEAVSAHIVLKKDSDLDIQGIIDFCSQHLVKYKVPTDINFTDELPKNTTGKILRRSLKDTMLKQRQKVKNE
ncbi:MAG TPA: fatty acid--CoA ligase family protein [Cerasibacillus sp.]|uniref:fatty acid--CoA ligase family protein n=1 Tax=Cerasibacillus sp. TaxID=2498711 RepID=UPI002F3E8C12